MGKTRTWVPTPKRKCQVCNGYLKKDGFCITCYVNNKKEKTS